MSNNTTKPFFIGHLGGEPEMRFTLRHAGHDLQRRHP